jgi:isopenicillin N synthase-like dioxygenase
MHNSKTYPPLFRQNLSKIPTHRVDSVVEPDRPGSDPIPELDLECMNHDVLYEACKEWGLFRLVNHGIPLTLLNQIHEHAKMVFDLEFEDKRSLLKHPLSYFWGTPALTPSGIPLHNQNFNWVEGLNVPLSQLGLFRSQDPLLHSFRILLEEYGKHQTRVAKEIYKAMIENLEMNQEKSSLYMSTSSGILRVYRYPLMVAQNKSSLWGMDVHTDSSIISILNQDQVGGLQILKDDIWIDVIPIPNTLIVHLGDMMQAISNDEYKSVVHRVKANENKERISMGYFVFPEENSLIRSSKYKPFSYADFRAQVQQDIKTVGFKVGLQRFKL